MHQAMFRGSVRQVRQNVPGRQRNRACRHRRHHIYRGYVQVGSREAERCAKPQGMHQQRTAWYPRAAWAGHAPACLSGPADKAAATGPAARSADPAFPSRLVPSQKTPPSGREPPCRSEKPPCSGHFTPWQSPCSGHFTPWQSPCSGHFTPWQSPCSGHQPPCQWSRRPSPQTP